MFFPATLLVMFWKTYRLASEMQEAGAKASKEGQVSTHLLKGLKLPSWWFQPI